MNWEQHLTVPSDPWDACWMAPLGGGLYAMVARTFYESGERVKVYTEYLVVTDVADLGWVGWSPPSCVEVARSCRPGVPTDTEWDANAPASAVSS